MQLHLRHPVTVPALSLGLLLAACAGAPPAPPPGIGDERVANVIHAAHNGEIQTGQMAAQRAADPRVRAFAQRMADEHTVSDQMLTAVQNPVAVTDSMAELLQRNAQHTRASLDTYEGLAFDRAYIDNQVAIHTWLLTNLDGTLIPSARTPAMRGLLDELRIAIADHLRTAQELQTALRAPQ